MPRRVPQKKTIVWLCVCLLIPVLFLLYRAASDADWAMDTPDHARDTRPSNQAFFDPSTDLTDYGQQWIDQLRMTYSIDDADTWQPADVVCTGHVLLAGKDDHAGTELFAFVQYDGRDPHAILYQPAIAITASDGSFTLHFTQMIASQSHAATDARIRLVTPAIMPPRLRLYLRHPGYDGLVLDIPFEQNQATQALGSVELLPTGAHAARMAASFGGKAQGLYTMFDLKKCHPQNIMAEHVANPALATCDDALYYFLTTTRRSGSGRQYFTNEDFHEGFVLFRKHFMAGKDNTGQLMSWQGSDNQDASWHEAIIQAEADFYALYFGKLLRQDPDAALDLIATDRRLLPVALHDVRYLIAQNKLADSHARDRIFFAMLAEPSLRFAALPNQVDWRDRRAVPILIAMLQEQPALAQQERGRVISSLSSILGLKGKEGRDRDWLVWWENEGQHSAWPPPPEPIEFEAQSP